MSEPEHQTADDKGCIWSWCRVHFVNFGRKGWTTIAAPNTGSCILKLRATCDGNDPACPERKTPRKG